MQSMWEGACPRWALSLTTSLKSQVSSLKSQVSSLKQLTAFFQTKCSQCGRGLAPDEALSLTTSLKTQTVDRILSDKMQSMWEGACPR